MQRKVSSRPGYLQVFHIDWDGEGGFSLTMLEISTDSNKKFNKTLQSQIVGSILIL